MHEMSDDERRAFLLEGTRTGKLATIRRDGRPHVVPIWFLLNGDDVLLTTGADTVKGRNILRDPRVCLCVDDEDPPFAYVMVEGEAEVTEDPDELLRWATRLGGRYMGADRAEEFGRRNAVEGELLVRIRPTKILARAAISD
ncbi:MAG: PPOX class F420-dependent oxidoreductase [Actinomycetota bacterium]|nr:PPOX class F420-dependent oxidoreductase [Actinomycetota bacterium]